MGVKRKWRLFEVFGVELEYMIVDQASLAVLPICDQVFTIAENDATNEVDRGPIAWSNELALHVLEIKSNGPTSSLHELNALFIKNIAEVNQILAGFGAKLLPGGAHPLMNPDTDMHIWPHEQTEIYHTYNRLFDCRGHGWSNLQSTHINLPFGNDEEFGRLHAAIRLLLPLLPALTASSPLIEGKPTGYLDTRLEFYRTNQKKIPTICGLVIPEAVFSEDAYRREIYAPMMAEIAAFDGDNLLEEDWLNSRGAIARFDRGAIEIRILDIQECPLADLALLALITATLKALTEGKWISYVDQQKWSHQQLSELFLRSLKTAENTVVENEAFAQIWGCSKESTMQDVWKILFKQLKDQIHPEFHEPIELVLNEGTLSSRILRALGTQNGTDAIEKVYHQLANCLAENRTFTAI